MDIRSASISCFPSVRSSLHLLRKQKRRTKLSERRSAWERIPTQAADTTLSESLHSSSEELTSRTAGNQQQLHLASKARKVFNIRDFHRSLLQGEIYRALQSIRQLAAVVRSSENESQVGVLRTGGTASATQEAALQLGSTDAQRYLLESLRGQHQHFFRLCLQKRNLNAALEYARLLPPIPELFSVLLKECLEHGDLMAVSRAVKARKEAGIPEDAYSYTALMKAAAKGRNAERVDAIFDRAWNDGVRDASIFNVLIGMHNDQRHTKAAFAAHERMLRLGVEPDAWTMNLLIQAAGTEGNMEQVKALYQQMKELGPQPTSYTFVQIFCAAHKSRDKDPAWTFEVYDDMLSMGFPPITQHVSTFLVACSEAPLSAAQIQQAIARALDFCNAAGGDCDVYSPLIKFCIAQGIPEKAMDIWKTIQKEGHRLNSWVFTALFSACAAYSSPEMQLLMSQVAEKLAAHWQQLSEAGAVSPRDARGMVIAHNALLNACAKSGKMAAAQSVFDSMQRHGPAPDIITYNTLLAGYAQAADTEQAFKVFHELRETSVRPNTRNFHLRPNVQTFGSLLHACARSGNAYSAKRVMELMSMAGVAPSAEAYTSLMHACIEQGSPENIQYAIEVFEQMKLELGCQPTAVTYGCMMNACEADGRVDDAFQLYQEACDRGLQPTDECHNILINIFAKNSRLEEALNVVKSLARAKGSRFQAGALNSLIRALAPDFVHRALRLLSFLRTLGLRVHRETLIALITACSKDSLIDQAHSLYWELRRDGSGTTREAGSHLIMALCRAGEPDLALKVYEDMVAAAQSSITALAKDAARQLAQDRSEHRPNPGASLHSVDGASERLMEQKSCNSSPQSTAATPSSGSSLQRPLLPASRRPLFPASPQRRQASRSGQAADMTAAAPNRGQELESGAAQSPEIRRILIFDESFGNRLVSASHPAEQSERQPQRGPPRHKRAVFPHARAMAALVQAFANQEDLDRAFMLYGQLQRDSVGAAAVTLSDRYMWQSLIEAACRKNHLPLALRVFDDWKVYCTAQTVRHRFDKDAEAYLPRLSNVTLAFLEACCRAAPEYEWRVYDVCAAMRQQQERKSQAALPRPKKKSHHFAEDLNIA